MTEKRYSLVYYADKGGAFIKNNETGTEWYHDSIASLLEIVNKLNGLAEENEQLKQRNENQYQQLNQLWKLIEAKDWETLTAMDNQMKEDEERLQREWKWNE